MGYVALLSAWHEGWADWTEADWDLGPCPAPSSPIARKKKKPWVGSFVACCRRALREKGNKQPEPRQAEWGRKSGFPNVCRDRSSFTGRRIRDGTIRGGSIGPLVNDGWGLVFRFFSSSFRPSPHHPFCLVPVHVVNS
ncbi:hypothetical protein MAPG_09779 [Magnaporthiopsis poae ATCC 64411]|uniref:Uncharacterized protein n=1 Tax=Magnaporthiopsis poae (strain ATCC 64411 / 73-15) TaxID=644358 RepID=A0A0C4EAU8_MAGP6|nr:hypothetical protein MAPG_09779 [Magnaporthiopsis poae ATCC 64411]